MIFYTWDFNVNLLDIISKEENEKCYFSEAVAASYEICRKGEMSHSDSQHQIKILKILHDVGLFSLRS